MTMMASFVQKNVDDTLVRMSNTDAATKFLTTLNGLHPSLLFTMELPVDDRIHFIRIDIIKNGTKLETQVYRKPTNIALLLQFHGHTDKRYKDSLLKTMLHRAYALSSTLEAFNEENAPNCAPFLAVLITLAVLQILLFPILFLVNLL